MIERHITPYLEEDLLNKMVFLYGPRQCGKTTLSKSILSKNNGQYYNWDIDEQRALIRSNQLDANSKFWVLDEIHKWKKWRNWLKGRFDLYYKEKSILVTGSAKLGVYSRGGDSLQGRYFNYRLHPFTFSELLNIKPSKNILEDLPRMLNNAPNNSSSIINDLLKLGSFPEPLLSGSERTAGKWRISHASRLINEEIRDLESIKDLSMLEILYDRLKDVIGSPLSINNLREDLEVAFKSVKHWINIFDNLYATFRLPPFGAPRIKAVKKEQKLYLFDWPVITKESPRFENLLAFHLLRLSHWLEDIEGKKAELRYFRNDYGKEVDFLILLEGKPWIAVEAKLSQENLDPNLKYFLERVKVPFAFQVSLSGEKDYFVDPINDSKIRILPAKKFLVNLP